MAFLKAAWRFIMGVKDVLVLMFLLLFFGVLWATLSMSSGERPATAHHGALLLSLEGTVSEQPQESDPLSLLSGNRDVLREYKLRDLLVALDAARTDNAIKAVVLDLDGFMGGGQVTLSRLAKAVDAVKASGKPVLAFATAYEDDGYQLASHASEIWLNPIGGVALTGPGGSQLYYKGLMDRLGVTAHIYRVGTYKSAVEPFLRTDQSPEARQANQALADRLWSDWQSEVGKARPKAQIARYVADPVGIAKATGGDIAQAALRAGLVDHLGDETAFGARVAELAGPDDDPEGNGYAAVALDGYVRAHRPANDGGIGVLTVSGEIIDGDAGPGTAGGDSIALLLRKALAERDLKALVVRVDSPGGSVLASEKIRSAILAARKQGLPVVTSMANVAASGGYWISTASNKIVAEPSTITGSIGVFGILPSFEGALAKIGITSDGIRTTPLSGEPNVTGGVSPAFDTVAQLGVEDMYRKFIAIVSRARGLAPQRVDSIAQGRVWDGGTARQLGLVDNFGTLDDAVALAAKLAGVEGRAARPYYIEPEPDPLTRLVQNMRSENAYAALPRDLLARQAWRERQWALRAVNDARLLTEGAALRASCLECAAWSAPTPAATMPTAGWWRWGALLRL